MGIAGGDPSGAYPCVEISVSDTGSGIRDDIRRKVFLPMFSTKGASGTGIGLAVVKKIMEEHGGQVRVVSAAGKGTTFILQFPLRFGGVSANNSETTPK